MSKKYNSSRPHVQATLRREAEIEAGHQCSVAHCYEHTYLDLHHIDGNRDNNNIQNVIILCSKHHRMAEKGEIDRIALREYKRLNREIAGLSKFTLSNDVRNTYLEALDTWVRLELYHIEGSPIIQNDQQNHIKSYIEYFDESANDTQYNTNLSEIIFKERKVLLLGNGGSGKTTTLLNWIQNYVAECLKDNQYLLPVYIALKNATVNIDFLSLVRSSLGKFSIPISKDNLENLLYDGQFIIIFDGLNEVRKDMMDAGFISDIVNFIDTYILSRYVISSRYITHIRELEILNAHVIPWNRSQIKDYLVLRLGQEVGEKIFGILGDDIDYEWMKETSVVGFASNPLTLWMIASNVEDNGNLPSTTDDIIETLIGALINRVSSHKFNEIPKTVIQRLLQAFAYQMLSIGDIQSTSYESAVEISFELASKHNYDLLPKSIDGYDLLALFTSTGLVRHSSEYIEWIHQGFQEYLSIKHSREKFRKFKEICELILCPECGYRADRYYDKDDSIWGVCLEQHDNEGESERHFKISLPQIPVEIKLRDNVKFIDSTNAFAQDGFVTYPKYFIDEGFMWILPIAGVLYMAGLSYAQDKDRTSLITRTELRELGPVEDNEWLIDLEMWALVESGLFSIQHKDNLSEVTIHTPSINPSARPYGYNLVTLRYMNYEELEEDPDDRFGITTPEKETYLEQRRKRNLPIEHHSSFVNGDKEKVFRIAKKYGGQVRRSWGSYEEVIVEFPGEAWDFSQYSTEE